MPSLGQKNSTQSVEASAQCEGRCAALVEALGSLCEAYEELATLSEQRHAAVRGVDHIELQRVLGAERAAAARLVQANQRRGDAVRGLEQVLGRPDEGDTTVGWIVERLGESNEAQTLRDGAARLRGLVESARDRLATDRLATDRIAGHIRGILRAATEQLNHAGTYGRSGTLEARGGQIVSAMDVTS